MKLVKLNSLTHLALKVFLHGPYETSSGAMRTIINSQIPTSSPYPRDPRTVSAIPIDVVNWVLVELRSNNSGPAVVSKSVFLHKNGNLVGDDGITTNISLGAAPGNYYIVVKTRNAIETWSSNPHSFNAGTIIYDFTTDSSKAYGSNMIKKGTKWCIAGGDVNRDGVVDISDLMLTDIDNLSFTSGYRSTDIDEDGIVDIADLIGVAANDLNFVSKITPTIVILKRERHDYRNKLQE